MYYMDSDIAINIIDITPTIEGGGFFKGRSSRVAPRPHSHGSKSHNTSHSQGHNPRHSQGHLQGHSQGHKSNHSQGHSPRHSQGHKSNHSQGHKADHSQGHRPRQSQGNNPRQSQNHNHRQSQSHNKNKHNNQKHDEHSQKKHDEHKHDESSADVYDNNTNYDNNNNHDDSDHNDEHHDNVPVPMRKKRTSIIGTLSNLINKFRFNGEHSGALNAPMPPRHDDGYDDDSEEDDTSQYSDHSDHFSHHEEEYEEDYKSDPEEIIERTAERIREEVGEELNEVVRDITYRLKRDFEDNFNILKRNIADLKKSNLPLTDKLNSIETELTELKSDLSESIKSITQEGGSNTVDVVKLLDEKTGLENTVKVLKEKTEKIQNELFEINKNKLVFTDINKFVQKMDTLTDIEVSAHLGGYLMGYELTKTKNLDKYDSVFNSLMVALKINSNAIQRFAQRFTKAFNLAKEHYEKGESKYYDEIVKKMMI